jgi:uncharacterized membrane protein YccC
LTGAVRLQEANGQNPTNMKHPEKPTAAGKNPPTPMHALRTAVAASASLLVAHLFRMPEAFWAAISCMVVMQSTLGAALPISVQRLVGTAIGTAAGALVGSFFGASFPAFAVSVFALGILCWALRIDRSAYRFAGITLAVVMLISRSQSAPIVALHRFIEVSLGIAVALALTTVWPEGPRAASAQGSR